MPTTRRLKMALTVRDKLPFVLVFVNLLKGFSFLSSIHFCKINDLFMLSLCISNYGCTREVWRARKMRKSCMRR